MIEFLNSCWNIVGGPYDTPSFTTNYAQKSVSFNVPAGTAVIKVYAYKDAGTSSADFDDISLTPVLGTDTYGDNNRLAMTYKGNWINCDYTGWPSYNNWSNITNEPNAYVLFSYNNVNGTDIMLGKNNTCGWADIYVDGSLYTSVNCYDPLIPSTDISFFNAASVPGGAHPVTIKNRDAAYIVVDKVVVKN